MFCFAAATMDDDVVDDDDDMVPHVFVVVVVLSSSYCNDPFTLPHPKEVSVHLPFVTQTLFPSIHR
ncbi:hypothetical protein Lalb_Chr08g0242801 [Lupinus albus]|uniref:Uncharacterized protein n=1 Tax=Lupinus albus TaxID=3870 RepID=A0A6A4Q6R5_LUPAL|nr:hypothetical protein Lalb_Chr08g0242801 [Lupinus albus]